MLKRLVCLQHDNYLQIDSQLMMSLKLCANDLEDENGSPSVFEEDPQLCSIKLPQDEENWHLRFSLFRSLVVQAS